MSIQELYRSRLAEIDQRVASQLSSVTGAKARFSDLLEKSMNPRTLQVIEANPPDGEVVLSRQDASDPMQAMMSMLSSSMMLSGMSALGGDSGGSSGSGVSSTMSTMMSMMMMQQLFDRLDKLATDATSETAPSEEAAAAAAPVAGVEATQAETDEAVQGIEEAGEAGQSANEVTAKPTAYDSIIQNAALRYQVDTDLIHGVIHAESGYRTGVVSSQGAIGIMQLMPDTASELGVRDPYDPEQNIQGGVAYLSRMLERFNGDEKLALAAYNCGPNKVESYQITDSDDPQQYQRLPQSVRNYVEKVMSYADGRTVG